MALFIADGAYDGIGVSNCLTEAFGSVVEIIIPPHKTAVVGLGSQRDVHIEHIAAHGRMVWKSETGYNNRALVETQIGRYKSVIGPSLKAREMSRQITETKIATKSLNRKTALGRAASETVT